MSARVPNTHLEAKRRRAPVASISIDDRPRNSDSGGRCDLATDAKPRYESVQITVRRNGALPDPPGIGNSKCSGNADSDLWADIRIAVTVDNQLPTQ